MLKRGKDGKGAFAVATSEQISNLHEPGAKLEIELIVRLSADKYMCIEVHFCKPSWLSLTNFTMHTDLIADKIIGLKRKEDQLRAALISQGKLSKGYDPEVEEMHISNAATLERIIDMIGYPTIEKVGREASEVAWLVIQHAIGRPSFMRKCRDLLDKAPANIRQTQKPRLPY